ncbi:MAG: hypothetical protein WCH98_15205, partial [Verrucomicrobiota bacterium]
ENEHGSNTGAWERAGKTAEGSAQRETSGSERVKAQWLQSETDTARLAFDVADPLCWGVVAAKPPSF